VLSVDEAIAGLLSEIERRDPVDVALDSAFGLILAADIASDVDSPPFDKSQMDGFAVRAQDVTNPPILLDVIEEVTAGNVPQRPIGPEQATRIMTGAPLPPGADAIVPIEQCDFTENGERVTVQSAAQVGAYVIRRGASMRLGEIVLSAGTRLQAPQIGLLAELGRTEVSVFQRPIVSILATGDELVEISEKPGPGQIRNSNETMLEAQIENADAWPCPLGIARDEGGYRLGSWTSFLRNSRPPASARCSTRSR